ncbi:MAG: sensor histidine kinase [Ktedonobacterales bacterium]
METGQLDSDPRERFFDDASHELRIPITALKGQIQLMQRRLRKDPARQDDVADLDRMLYQVHRLNHQLDVLLASTQIRQKRYAILLAPCDIVAIARQLVAVYAAGTTSHTVRLESSVDELIGDWDRRRIEEALAVLLSNAVKYSPPGRILVLVTHLGDVAHVEVQDKGLGVPSRERSAIFHAYTTGSRSESAGIGLGLYVAREAIRRQHGRIGVRSGEGSGSSFWFDLPLKQPVPRPRRSSYRRSNHAAASPASALSITQATESPETSTHLAIGVI